MPPKPFKPPRPSAAATTSTAKKTSKSKTTTRKPSESKISKPKPQASGSSSFSRPIVSSPEPDADSEDPFASPGTLANSRRRPNAAHEADSDIEMLEKDGAAEEVDEKKEHIPQNLLTRLLHEGFKEEGTRISKDANLAIGRYMDIFVRETLSRAAFARADEIEKAGGGGIGDGFLEVEDLEKLAPQLLLDF